MIDYDNDNMVILIVLMIMIHDNNAGDEINISVNILPPKGRMFLSVA